LNSSQVLRKLSIKPEGFYRLWKFKEPEWEKENHERNKEFGQNEVRALLLDVVVERSVRYQLHWPIKIRP
jgi:hypothetical protein